MPKLILKFESAVIKEYPLSQGQLAVGRKPDNDVVIDHPAVSGHHCRILFQGDTYFVEDLNSTNGTMVNGKKVIKAGIHNQDVITVAKHTLTLVDDRAVSAQDIAQQMAEPAPAAAAPAPKPAEAAPAKKSFEKIGGIRVTEGIVDQIDFTLTENSTYIGKSDRVTIKIKGGLLTPEVAAMISRKADGYVLVAIKEGFPHVNGMPVEKERVLNEGDVIEVGGTKIQFYLKNA